MFISYAGTGEHVVLSTAPECPGTHWYQCRYSPPLYLSLNSIPLFVFERMCVCVHCGLSALRLCECVCVCVCECVSESLRVGVGERVCECQCQCESESECVSE